MGKSFSIGRVDRRYSIITPMKKGRTPPLAPFSGSNLSTLIHNSGSVRSVRRNHCGGGHDGVCRNVAAARVPHSADLHAGATCDNPCGSGHHGDSEHGVCRDLVRGADGVVHQSLRLSLPVQFLLPGLMSRAEKRMQAWQALHMRRPP